MENIKKIGLRCVGCRSCEQICPKKCLSMVGNNEGFLYPKIDDSECVKCSLCLTHCPMEETNFQEERTPLNVYGLKSKDTKRVMNSASGGASDLLSQYIISLGGVVFGCAYTDNLKVQHILVNNHENLYKLQSSKYVQSNLKDCYTQAKKLLNMKKIVLFTGTPCQIAGLYTFLGNKQYENLYTLDLICHGVPSPKMLEKYFEYMNKKLGEPILSYNFRSKDKYGWGTQYIYKIQTVTKTKENIFALSKYGKHFTDANCYRECCYKCNYANLNRVGDITIGDFWGIYQVNPDFFSNKGVSSLLVNTHKGQNLLKSIDDKIDIFSCSVQDILINQGNLLKSTSRPKIRDDFYKNIDDKNFIDNLKVGLSLKQRTKAVLPKAVIQKVKVMIPNPLIEKLKNL